MLENRYELSEKIGSGGFGTTFLALDHETGDRVVVKELNLEQTEDWKSVELFEREAKLLETLAHHNIPNYIDSFELEESGKTRFFLVQQFAPGESLAQKVNNGWRATPREAEAMLTQILETLAIFSDSIRWSCTATLNRKTSSWVSMES